MNGINGQLDSGNGGGGRPTVMTSTTYAELKQLRDSNGLTPGTWYRITDYTCTTTQDETQSAGHVFDIIVRADDASHLNENAYAAHHEGDTYFQDCKLEAWELKYCIDNDNTRFAWADEDGKGVIFFMKDEWNNQCPYDFKNIMFKRYLVTEYDNVLDEILNNSDWTPSKYIAFEGLENEHIDEYDESDSIFLYTFSTNSYEDTDAILDASLNTKNNNNDTDAYYVQFCNDNEIGQFMAGQEIDGKCKTVIRLNNIVISDRNELFEEGNEPVKIYGNVFGVNCHDMMFESHSYCNTFKANCKNNLFFKSYYNTIGNYCSGNTFGNECYNNTFGNDCQYNTFGNECCNNTFGNNCWYNTFGNNCQYNTFGNYCCRNTFGNNCQENTFGNYCQYNTFGNECWHNTFGNNCSHNTFGNYVETITVFDGVMNCSVTGGSSSSVVKNAQILNGTAGASSSNKLTISFAANKSYTQVAGKNTSGTLKIFNPADNA